jgi:predicted DNA-binding protein
MAGGPANAGCLDVAGRCPTWYPTRVMKKTSVYLSDEDRDRLARLAEREGKSQALVLREALALYDAQTPDLDFEIFKMEPASEEQIPRFETGQEFQDWMDNVAMKGFGEDGVPPEWLDEHPPRS